MGGSLSPSCLILERPGRWRMVGLFVIGLVLVMPSLPVLVGAIHAIGETNLGLAGYMVDLGRGVGIGTVAAILGLAVGWPSGVITGLFSFRGRRLLLAVFALPLVVPSFLLGLGWSMVGGALPVFFAPFFDGVSGVVLVFFAPAYGLTALTALAATMGLSASQVEAARIAGGRRAAIRAALVHAAPVTFLAAVLAAVLSLGDPGPGQVFGVRTAASDLLVSFSATYNFGLAGLQCGLLAAVVLVGAIPAAIGLAPMLARATPARSTRLMAPMSGNSPAWPLLLWTIAALVVVAPCLALVLPMLRGPYLGRALGGLVDTALDTVVFAGGAALVAVVCALAVAVLTGRERGLRQVVVTVAVALFCLPPALSVLGAVRLATSAPQWMDFLLRGSAGVCLAQGLRLAPLAVILLLRAWGATAPSWTHAAVMSGMTLKTFGGRVLLPVMAPALATAGLLVALLASADIGSVLLLAPPGRSSFSLRIFTVMANAPQALVAALCCVYVVVAVAGVAVVLKWGVKDGK